MYIVSFDPGETTGMVVGEWYEWRPKTFNLAFHGEIPWGRRFAGVKDAIRTYSPDFVVVESFRLYSHRAKTQIGKDFPSVQVIGIIQTYMYEAGILDRLMLQPAAVRSSVKILPDHLKLIGSSPHIQDAYRHLRYFVIVDLLKQLWLLKNG